MLLVFHFLSSGFNKFIEQFEKARWVSSVDEIKKQKAGRRCALDITFSTLDPSSYSLDELNKRKQNYSSSARERRPSTNPIAEFFVGDDALTRSASHTLVTSMMQKPYGGVTIKDRIWKFKLYEQSFIGCECIDWITLHFTDIESREAAAEYANELLEKGVFIHMNKKHKFLDGHYFYRISSEFVIQSDESTKPKSVSSWFLSKFGRPGALLTNESSDSNLSVPKNLDLVIDPIQMTKSFVADIDPNRRSNRRETAILHYDTVYNPVNCYHFQLHWLVCTAKLIQDMLTSWSRMAEKCGFLC